MGSGHESAFTKTNNKMKKKPTPKEQTKGRNYLSQLDVPSTGLSKALRIAEAIKDNYGYKPSSPLEVAAAVDMAPTSGTFKMLTGASIAYGITEGAAQSGSISLTELGLRVVKPTKEGDDFLARREAFLKPRIVSEFLTKYDGAPIPRTDIAENVLNDMGVPSDRTSEVLQFLVTEADSLGLLKDIKGRKYVHIKNGHGQVDALSDPDALLANPTNGSESRTTNQLPTPQEASSAPFPVAPHTAAGPNRRVFVTHGKNRTFIDPIRKLLTFGEMEAIVSAERQSVSQPVPDKVMEDMRSCAAAIIHVEGELKLMDKEANEQVVLNPNVLIEIGAAMALYGRRFILLVQDGCKLPSNLQGLYEVRYTGDSLDGDATIRLLEAINKMKSHSVPIPAVTAALTAMN